MQLAIQSPKSEFRPYYLLESHAVWRLTDTNPAKCRINQLLNILGPFGIVFLCFRFRSLFFENIFF